MRRNKAVILVTAFALLIRIHHVDSSNVLTLNRESDDESNLQQALYIVKLLKSGYTKDLSENSDLDAQIDNSTCPENEYNATTPVDASSVPVSARPAPLAMIWPPAAGTLPQPPLVPGASLNDGSLQPPLVVPPPPALPFAANPSLPILHSVPSGNITSEENKKYPYRPYRRRMMPDYHYYDVIIPRYRNINLQSRTGAGAETFESAYYKRQSDAESLNAALRTYQTEADSTVSPEPTVQQSELVVTEGPQIVRAPVTIESPFVPDFRRAIDVIPLNRTHERELQTLAVMETKHLTNNTSKLEVTPLIEAAVNQSGSRFTEIGTTLSSILATPKTSFKYVTNEKPNMLRREKFLEKHNTEDPIMLSQVAAEIMREMKSNKPDNTTGITKNGMYSYAKRQHKHVIPKSTMKIYLQGSTRIPVPLPENNAYCHLNPRSSLCSFSI